MAVIIQETFKKLIDPMLLPSDQLDIIYKFSTEYGEDEQNKLIKLFDEHEKKQGNEGSS